MRENKVNIPVTIILVLLAAVVVFPVFWMLRSSLMDNVELNLYPPHFIPQKWMFANYPETLSIFRFGRYLLNTLMIAIPSVIGVVVTASMAGYAFARMEFPGKRFLFSLCIASMLMPVIVTVVPIFLVWSTIGAYDTHWPLIVPQFLGGGAFNIFLIRQFLMGVPRELDEAAMIDGASRPRILVEVLLPTIKPVLITVALFTFIISWNDVLGPVIYLGTEKNYTISLGLNMFRGGYGTNWKAIMAASTMSVTPALILYTFAQKYFVEGITLSGIKG